jgi:hypothetical protein
MVWNFGFDDGMGVTCSLMELDGDLKKIEYENQEYDPHSVGGTFESGKLNLGRRLNSQYVPTRFQWGGPKSRTLPDALKGRGMLLVSEKLKGIVETFEPGVHQFFPIELVFKKDGDHAANMYFLNICNRLDSVDRNLTTWPFVKNSFEPADGKELVFDLEKVSNNHLWHDKHIYFGWMTTDALHDAMIAAGITGLVFHKDKTNEDFE